MVTAAHLTTAVENSNNSSVNTASITPSPNKLIVLVVRHHRTGGGVPNTPTVAGCNLTWVLVATRNLTADNSHRISMFRALGTPTAGALTIDFGGQNQDERSWSVSEFGDVDTGGANGANAVVQSATNDVAGTPLSVTLGGFANSNNATHGVMSTNQGSAITHGANFTELGNTASSGAIESEWASGNQTTVNWTFTGGSFGAGIAIEIKAQQNNDDYAYFI